MKDKIKLTRGTVTLTLEPFGQGWCVSASKLIDEFLSTDGNLMRKEKIQMSIYFKYDIARASFERGARTMTGAEFHFDDLCQDCFGFTSIEEITYQR